MPTPIRFAFGICLLSFAASLQAMIIVGGKEPVKDANWPAGSLDVANHRARMSWYEGPPFGGGQWVFQYRGETAAFNQVLAKFAQIKAPDLLLIIHEGPAENPVATAEDKAKGSQRLDWTYTIWTPENFYHLYGNSSSNFASDQPEFRAELPPPQLDVFVAPGGVDLNLVQMPTGLRVVDERAASHGYQPEDGSVIVGTVYDMLTSKPVPAVEVVLATYEKKPAKEPSLGAGNEMGWKEITSAVGDADGRFELKNIPEGNYDVMVRCIGYAPRVLGSVQGGKGRFKSYTIKMLPGVEQTGRVVDGEGKPVVNAKVRVDSMIAVNGRGYPLSRVNEKQEVLTDADGKFTLTGLPRGEAGITVWADHLQQVDFLKMYQIPGPPLLLKMVGTGTIRGKVIGRNGAPADGTVSVWDQAGEIAGTWGGSMNLLEGGTFLFENVPPGKYYITANPAMRFQKNPTGTPLVVKTGKTVEVELKK